MTALPAGTKLAGFALARENGERFTEQDLQGLTTVLVFYPFAFSPVCTNQLQLYERSRAELTAAGAQAIYGVSCDSTWSQTAFKEKLGVSIPQLSDFEPKGAASETLGVLNAGGFCERALIITAPDGTVRWSYQAPSPAELPSVELLLQGLQGS